MLEGVGLRALRLFEPERAHRLALKALAAGLVAGDDAPDPENLATMVFGRRFPNPVGVAAGFDKHCEALGATFRLGPGFTEIGGVTPKPQFGNPKPRLFRLTEDRAVINRFGFNSEGHAVVAERLEAARADGVDGIVGVNLAVNKDSADPAEDYAHGVAAFGRPADFVTVNVSSPNTQGLRDLQGEAALARLLERAVSARDAVAAESRPALLVKVAPDLDSAGVAAIADVALSFRDRGLAGLVVSNTTIARPPSLKSRHAAEAAALRAVDRRPEGLRPPDRRPPAADRRWRRRVGRGRLRQDPRRRLAGAALFRPRLPGPVADRPHQARVGAPAGA